MVIVAAPTILTIHLFLHPSQTTFFYLSFWCYFFLYHFYFHLYFFLYFF